MTTLMRMIMTTVIAVMMRTMEGYKQRRLHDKFIDNFQVYHMNWKDILPENSIFQEIEFCNPPFVMLKMIQRLELCHCLSSCSFVCLSASMSFCVFLCLSVIYSEINPFANIYSRIPELRRLKLNFASLPSVSVFVSLPVSLFASLTLCVSPSLPLALCGNRKICLHDDSPTCLTKMLD